MEPVDGTDNSGIMSVFTTNVLANLDPAFVRRCTPIYMGYIDDAIERIRLIEYFYNDTVVWTEPASPAILSGIMSDWVPGDHVRFIKDVWNPARTDEYFRLNAITPDAFWIQVRKQKSRIVNLDLPRLPSTRLMELAQSFSPTTPR